MRAATSMLESIGNTPLVRLQKIVPDDSAQVLVKLEYFNPTGSYKDRMALAMVEEAEKRGELRPGMTIVECTGGNTGSSLAFVCAVKGYPLKVICSDAFSKEKLKTMRAFGAELIIVPSEGGRVTPDLMPRMMELAREMAQDGGTYFTNQFYNPDSIKGQANIGHELLEQIEGAIDGFCSGIGTAGVFMGVVGVLRAADYPTYVTALEPASSPLLSEGKPGSHKVEGISNGFVPPLIDKSYYHEARGIDEVKSRHMVRLLAKQEGIFAGISTGLNVVGALELAQRLGAGHTVVTIAVDSGMKYLTGDLFED
jgi:cysteine synthase A